MSTRCETAVTEVRPCGETLPCQFHHPLERERAAVVRAPREAAEELQGTGAIMIAGSYRATDYTGEYADWLRDRAADIEQEDK